MVLPSNLHVKKSDYFFFNTIDHHIDHQFIISTFSVKGKSTMASHTIFITFPRTWTVDDLKEEIKTRTGIDEFMKIKPLNTPAVYLACKSTSDCEKIIASLNGVTANGYSMKVKFADEDVRRPQVSPGITINPLTNVKIKNLSEKTTEEDLRRLFESLGCNEILSMTIFDVEEDGSKQTRAFICFSEFKDLKKIRERPLYLHGNKLFIEPTTPKNRQKVTENSDVFTNDEETFPKLTALVQDVVVHKTDEQNNDVLVEEKKASSNLMIQSGIKMNQKNESDMLHDQTIQTIDQTKQTCDREKYTTDVEFRVGTLEYRIANLECTIDYLYRYIEMMHHPGNPNLSKSTYDQYTSEQVSRESYK